MPVAEERERILPAKELGKLITALADRDYDVIGPVMRDGAIVYDRIERMEDCPRVGPMNRTPAVIA